EKDRALQATVDLTNYGINKLFGFHQWIRILEIGISEPRPSGLAPHPLVRAADCNFVTGLRQRANTCNSGIGLAIQKKDFHFPSLSKRISQKTSAPMSQQSARGKFPRQRCDCLGETARSVREMPIRSGTRVD